MKTRIYALLAGINDYSSSVGKLSGCLNDIDHFNDYLTDNFDSSALNIEVLKDADATRPNIIKLFRSHLAKASANDVVVFQYCGHGARSKSAKPFKEFFPDSKDEGLVCYDSRQDGGFDLADKELAVLLSEVARNQPHIAVILDCCHSGSATRSADDFTLLKPRQTHERFDERPLETYLNNYYVDLEKRGESLVIPASAHIALAACERYQKAWEARDHSGVFTSTLLEVLSKTGTAISYADLFMRCRAMVHKRADNQNPQFETYGGFHAYGGFLGSAATGKARRYPVTFVNDYKDWQVACGAIHGMPSESDKNVELTLYTESERSQVAGHASITQVSAQHSVVEFLDIEPKLTTRFVAEIASMPQPLAICVEGDTAGTQRLYEHLADKEKDQSHGVALIDVPEGARYTLSADNNRYLLKLRETDKLIQGVKGYTDNAVDYIFSVLKRVAAWERAVVLQNHSTRMNVDDVQLKFYEQLGDESLHEYSSGEITFDIAKTEDGNWADVCGKLKAKNKTSQKLHFLLVYFSEEYEINTLYNEPVAPTDTDLTLTFEQGAEIYLGLEEDEGDTAVHTFKLIVSTEKVDDFLLGQEALTLGKIVDLGGGDDNRSGTRGATFGKRKKLVHKNEWFTKDVHIKLVRQQDRVSVNDAALANSRIIVKGHKSLQADVSLSAATTATRGVGSGADIYRVLERQGMEMLNFSGTRGDNQNVLELTGIQNSEVLAHDPLEIELDLKLADDEFILPLTFDGEHIVLCGDPSQDEQGRTHISISEIPNIRDNRRSLGKALKLYFFKSWLKRKHVNELCWVQYEDDGEVERHEEGVADKVAAAKNVLLLVHGIIGNTQGMAECLAHAKDQAGTAVNEKFDLVLTYDYENLSTPIEKTAVELKRQLHAAGLHKDDNKQLTLLAHSMGGLVSRWFIEKEGGNKLVDHLVMCGTPNIGSPFGKIDSARKISQVLTTMALNAFPVFAPFGGALIYALNRSKKLTPCLEQMNSDSPFIKQLNVSDDPGVRYTIVAGDTREFKDQSGELAASLVAKVGRGAIFDKLYNDAGHDIAVSVESILGVSDTRTPAPLKQSITGHHLNYFVNEASLRTLAEIKW